MFLLAVPAHAADDCGWNSSHTYYSCDGFFSGSETGGSAPIANDAINESPASIPQIPTPLGFEGIISSRAAPGGNARGSVSLIKGFHGIGVGAGSWTEGTLTSPDYPDHFLGSAYESAYRLYEQNPPSTLGFRLGAGVSFPQFLLPNGIRLSAGGSLGVGRGGDNSPQVGAIAEVLGLGLGYTKTLQQLSPLLPKVTVSDFSVGWRVQELYVGYSNVTLDSSAKRSFSQIYGLRWTGPIYTLYGNLKMQKDQLGNPYSWTRAGIQRRFAGKVNLGYEYGLYRYSHSLALQLYL